LVKWWHELIFQGSHLKGFADAVYLLYQHITQAMLLFETFA
jgi:hypothetical protein